MRLCHGCPAEQSEFHERRARAADSAADRGPGDVRLRDRPGDPGVVYPVLHGLEREGALKATRKSVGGRSRIYYAVTPEGTRRLTELAGTWTRLTEAIQSVFAQSVFAGETHVEAV
jgi:DNA-binding PadR family transcriptional regulator